MPPLPRGEGWGEGAWPAVHDAEGTLTRPPLAGDLSPRERSATRAARLNTYVGPIKVAKQPRLMERPMAPTPQDNPLRAPPIEAVSDLVLVAGHLRRKTVIVAGGDREDDLRLVESARDHAIVERCILVGDGPSIRRAADQVRIPVADEDIIATASQEETAARTVERVLWGGVDVILKGNISTPILNRAMMRIVVRNTISLVTMFDAAPIAGGRPMLLTDPGVTTVCSFGRMVGLVENAVDVARSIMGIERPRVAILSANEKVIDSLPSTKMADALAQRPWDNAIVYGPLSFDLAVDPGSVGIKGLGTHGAALEVAGKADVLVCPCIDSANVLYKVIMQMVNYGLGTFAGITVGVQVPYVILSRADNVETKLQSLALCSIAAERMDMREHRVQPRRAVSATPTRPYRVLIVNPGATSTKVALFEGDRCAREAEVPHEAPPDAALDIEAEARRREAVVREFLREHDIRDLDAVVARGGLLPRPAGKLPGGTYVVAEVRDGAVVVDQGLVKAIAEHAEGYHASNLGIPMAAELAREFTVPAFVVDPVVVDEFCPEAEISGYAPIARRSVAHVLSVRSAAVRMAEKTGAHVEHANYVVAHLGSGITVAAVRGGRIVDNNIALLGEGPFTPQRAGTLPLKDLIELCYSGRFTKEELFEELTQRGGLQSYLGEHRMPEIERRIEAGDKRARLVVEAMAYQIAKAVGAMAVAVGPDCEAVILTGGLARSDLIVRSLKRRLTHLLPVLVVKDTLEMEEMALGACRVLAGQQQARRYLPPV
ncbi:MAG: butyrate kinase [Planctomycetes bacterium]|nr:butyrate kinase [Planctomycetota bacterium]